MEFCVSEKVMDTEGFEQTLSQKQEQLEGICRSIWSVVSFAAVEEELCVRTYETNYGCGGDDI